MPLLALGSTSKAVYTGGGDNSPPSSTTGGKPGAASINLHTFRTLVGDAARSYFFQIDIPPVSDSSQQLTMLAKSTILPPCSLEDKGFEFQGSKYKMAGHMTFDDWTVTFICDEYQKLRHNFLAWQSLIYDPIRQIPFTAGSYKKSGVKVFQLSKDGDVVSGYEFFGLYPSRVGEVNLDQSSREISTFSVTFSYDYYIINTNVGDNDTLPSNFGISDPNYAIKQHNNEPFDDSQSFSHLKKDKAHITVDTGVAKQAANGNSDWDTKLSDFKINKAHITVDTGVAKQAANGNSDWDTKLSDFKINKATISNTSDDKQLLIDAGGNQEVDYNSKGEKRSKEGALVSFLQNINPFGRKGDINTPDPATFLDYANWMPLRYSPPLGFRIRKFLPSGINKAIDSVRVPNINPYAWTGLQKPK